MSARRYLQQFAWPAAVFLSVCLLPSCATNREPPLAIAMVCDLSASIEPDARVSMFESIESVFKVLRRGDTLTIIPVTGDAETDSPGRILRFQLSTDREVYDQDLRRVGAEARKTLEAMAARAKAAPSLHTDLLGALGVAAEETAALHQGQRKIVVVLSDFVQDDNQFDFKKDGSLSRPAAARPLAARLSEGGSLPFENVHVFLGYLRSRDLARLSRERRQAIREFWTAYVQGLGASPRCVTDGPGLLPGFLDEARASRQDPPHPATARVSTSGLPKSRTW